MYKTYLVLRHSIVLDETDSLLRRDLIVTFRRLKILRLNVSLQQEILFFRLTNLRNHIYFQISMQIISSKVRKEGAVISLRNANLGHFRPSFPLYD